METIQIMLDKELLRTLDSGAQRAKVSRSAFVREALREHLRRLNTKEPEARERGACQEHPDDVEEVERRERVAA